MLALYRSGRQADALGAYQDARRTLVDELGLEPGPELRARHEAILRQDPALDPPPGRRRRPPTRGPRAAPVLLLAGGALLALVVVAAVVLVGDGDEPATASARVVPGNSLVALDARTGDVQAVVPTGSTPTSVATGGGGVWALNADDKTLTRAESATGAARTFTVPGTPFGVTAGDGAVWVATGSDSRYRSETVVRRVLELAPTTGAVRRDVALPRDESGQEPVVNAIAATRDAVWVIGPGNRLFRIAVEGAAAPARVPWGCLRRRRGRRRRLGDHGGSGQPRARSRLGARQGHPPRADPGRRARRPRRRGRCRVGDGARGRPAVARDPHRGALDRRGSGCAGGDRGRRRGLGGERCAGHGRPGSTRGAGA